jgi:hypothetical protein
MQLAQEIQKKLAENFIFVELNWIQKCIEFLQTRHNRTIFNNNFESNFLELVYIQFLKSDLNRIGQHSLPPNIIKWHDQVLKGYHVVQIDEIVNIGEPLENRFIF